MLMIDQKIPSSRTSAFTQIARTVFNCSHHNHHCLASRCMLPLGPTKTTPPVRHKANGIHKEALLLTICPNAETFHASWIRQTPTIRTSVLADPLSRLQRPRNLFGSSAQAQCCSVLIDPSDALKAHLTHHLRDLRMNSLEEVLITNHRLPGPLPQETSLSSNKGAFTSCIL